MAEYRILFAKLGSAAAAAKAASSFQWNDDGSCGVDGDANLEVGALDKLFIVYHPACTALPVLRRPFYEMGQLCHAGCAVLRGHGVSSKTFADVPLTNTQHFVVDLDAYAGALPAQPVRGAWGVSLLKNPAADAGEIIGPSLLEIGSSSYDGSWIQTGQFDFSETHGTPFDASWPTMARTGYEVYLPGTTGPLDDEPRYYAYTTELLRSPDHVVAVFAAFARSVMLNGQALEQATVRQDPHSPMILAIDLPSEAQRFTLVLSQWITVGNMKTLAPRISIESALPEIELPASAVPAGQYYAYVWSSSDQETTHSAAYRDIGKFAVQ